MPRSQNRRYLEIPAKLYESLQVHATAEQRPVAAVVADLVTDGLTVREYLLPMQTELREMRRELEALRLAVENRLPPWTLPGVEPTQQLPSKDQGEQLPSKPRRRKAAPAGDQPAVSSVAPGVEPTQQLPSKDQGEQLPSNDQGEQLPSKDQGEQLPSKPPSPRDPEVGGPGAGPRSATTATSAGRTA